MKKVISSVGFILLKDDKFIVEKRKHDKRVDPDKLCIPSGGIKKGETPEEALWRECEEEFGIKITEYFFINRLLYKHKKGNFLINYFVVTSWEGKIKCLEAEKLLWVNKNNPKELDLDLDKKAIKQMNQLIQKKEFGSILSNYSIGQYVLHKHVPQAFENTVYFLQTTKGKYVLKIFEQTKVNAVKNQSKIQEYLASKNNPVPNIIKAKNGKDILYYQGKPIQIQEFADGKRVKLTNKLIRKYGKVIGKIDSDLMKLKLPKFNPWGVEFEFKTMKIYPGKKLNLKKEHSKLLKEIKKLNKHKLTKSIVHGDLNLDNTLVYKNKINAIIDFGDSHTGFLVTDPMIFICDEIVTKKSLNYKKINLFLNEYEKKMKLNKEGKKAVFEYHVNLGKGLTKEEKSNIGDIKSFEKMLTEFGFRKLGKIEKIREVYHFDKFTIFLDKVTGVGVFISINTEGDKKDWIEKKQDCVKFLEKLGLSEENITNERLCEIATKR